MEQTTVCHLVLSLNIGGTERMVEHLIRSSPQKSYCICLDSLGEIGEALHQEFGNIELIQRKESGFSPSVPFRIARFLRNNRIEILHCHHYTPWFYGVQACLLRRSSRILFTEHGRLFPDLPSWKRRAYNQVFQRWTHGVTAVSPSVRNALNKVEAFDSNRIEIVYNGIDPARFPSEPDRNFFRAQLGLDHQKTYAVFSGRFDPIKWLSGLVEAFLSIADAAPELELILIGDGPEREKLEAMVKSGGMVDRVHFPGFCKNVPEWLMVSDLFVLCSVSEGTSVSLIESMAASIPAVATNVGGTPYVIEENKTGILVPSQDSRELGKALLYLTTHPDVRTQMGLEARRRFEGQFSLKVMLDSYQTCYRNLFHEAIS